MAMDGKDNKNDTEGGCALCQSVQGSFQKVKQPSRKAKFFFLGLVIIGGIFAVYELQSTFSSKKANNQNPLSPAITATKTSTPQIGQLAPDFVSEDILGNRTVLRDFRNETPVMVVFWASWCNICAQELEDLKAFTSKHQGHIQVLAVDSGEPRKTLKNYIQEKNINFLMLLDEKREIWNQYLVRGTPSHFLVDQEGKIFTVQPGLASLSDLETMLAMLPPKGGSEAEALLPPKKQ